MKYWQCNMSLSIEDMTLIKNLYQFKEYGSRRIVSEFLKINCKLKKNTLLKTFKEQEAPTKGMKAAGPKIVFFDTKRAVGNSECVVGIYLTCSRNFRKSLKLLPSDVIF